MAMMYFNILLAGPHSPLFLWNLMRIMFLIVYYGIAKKALFLHAVITRIIANGFMNYSVRAKSFMYETTIMSFIAILELWTLNVILSTAKCCAEETSLKMRSDFITSINHEIRNPLQTISYSVQYLAQSRLNQIEHQCVQSIGESTRVLSLIIDNILGFSELESGRLQLNEREMSILHIVESVGENFSLVAHNKGLNFMMFVDPCLPVSCIGDSDKISQILRNFLCNAFRFTLYGKIKLSAELESSNGQDSQIIFKCSDTGIGLHEHDCKRVFNKFSQIKDFGSASPTEYQGWGIGLAIAEGFAKLMNGTVGVKSKLGEGSTFWLRLKLKNCDSKRIMDDIPSPSASNTIICVRDEMLEDILEEYLRKIGVQCVERVSELNKGTRLSPYILIQTDDFIDNPNFLEVTIVSPLTKNQRKKILKLPLKFDELVEAITGEQRAIIPTTIFDEKCTFYKKKISILLVEDNRVIQTLLQQLLRKCGITNVVTASNGAEAVEIVEKRKEPFGMILMDIQMPVLDGYEATKRILRLKDPLKARTPIIATSANADQDCVRKCLEYGMKDVLLKPVTIDMLLGVIQRYAV